MKTMLRIPIVLSILASSMSLSAFAQTANGKTFVPPFDARGTSFHQGFLLTNVTNSPISVTITIYSSTGLIVTSGISSVVGTTNFVSNPGGATATFIVAANGTALTDYNTSVVDVGYATIAWSQTNSSAQYGLIADVVSSDVIPSTSLAMRTLAVNDGKPF